MVVVNFKIVMGASERGPDWMVGVLGLLEGRAAATFVVLAGVGLSLLSARARKEADAARLGACRRVLLRRAAFLFCLGLAYTPIWPADILHFYGIYIALGALLLGVPGRRLWTFAAGLVAGFVAMLLVFDYERGWNWETLEYAGFWTPPGLVRHLLFNGFHPVVPWAAFLLVGMWLGRLDMAQPRRRRRLLLASAAVIVAAELLSRLALRSLRGAVSGLDDETLQALVGTGPMPPMPPYMLSGGASAIVAIVICLMLGDRCGASVWARPLIATGQLALTNYVAHVVIGMGALEALGWLHDRTLGFAVAAAATFCGAAAVFSLGWRQRLPRGPLELLMRRLTG
jgi:uncharacterized membrane protein YeiB